jgi:hypothetical protein
MSILPSETERDNPCLNAALDYLARGWSAIPLCPPDHAGVGQYHARNCCHPGKAPLIPWKEFTRRRATEAELRGWWEQHPNANSGIVLGSISGLIGLDVDGPEGEELLQEFSRGDLPATLTFSTPGGGRRVLYALPAGTILKTQGIKRGGGELRILAEGSITVMPPSRHCIGGLYGWMAN